VKVEKRPEKSIMVFTKIFNCFQLIIKLNVSSAANQHIIIISEGSCDTEDWRNYAENSAFTWQEYITFYIILNDNIISQYCCFLINKCSLGEQ